MNGKYAKYIPSSYGFITKLEVKGDTLLVHTKETAKGEPHKYPLKGNMTDFSERLENQYRLITEEENLQIVKKDLVKDSKKMLNQALLVLSAPVFLASFFSALALSALPPVLIGIVIEIILMSGHAITLDKISKNFDEEMDMVRTYLSARTDIEQMYQKDTNVTGNLKSTTISRIELNNELRKTNPVAETFDIMLLDDLMSKATSKKELKKLLTNYMICVALRQQQVFVNPNEKPKVKVRSKYDD
jgi:hypothetical protein